MTEEAGSPIMEAEIGFGEVSYGGLTETMAVGVFEGRVRVGSGRDREEAFQDLILHAYPSTERIEYGPQAAMHLPWSEPEEPVEREVHPIARGPARRKT